MSRLRHLSTPGAIVALALMTLGALGGPARAQAASTLTWTEGTSVRSFSVPAPSQAVIIDGTAGGPELRLARTKISEWKTPGTSYVLRSVYPAADGGTLIAAGVQGVIKVGRANAQGIRTMVRQYVPPAVPGVDQVAFSTVELSDGSFLVADREGFVVYEVSPGGVYENVYGVLGRSSVAGDCLTFPFSASRTASGTTLITDAGNDASGGNGSFRVIEVDPTRASGSRIVWSFTEGRPTNTGNGLISPRWAERIGDKVIIADAGRTGVGPGRVLYVDYATKVIEWARTLGSDFQPAQVRRLDNGNFLVSDTGSTASTRGRVLELTATGEVVDEYSTGPLAAPGDGAVSGPRGAYRTPAGTTIIADNDNRRLLEIAYETRGTAISAGLDMLAPSVVKSFTDVTFSARMPAGTSVSVAAEVDGNGEWVPAADVAGRHLVGESIRYRVTMTTTDRAVTPVLDEVRIGYDLTTAADDGTGDGSGDGNGIGDGPAGGDVPWVPAASGTGSGRGYGTGTGNGTGTGTGAGLGTASAGGTGGAAGATVTASATGNPTEIVSGRLMASVGGSAGPGGHSGGAPRTTLLAAAPGLLLLCALFVAGLSWDGLRPGSGTMRRLALLWSTVLRP